MSFWGELRKRNVIKVAAAYAVVAWLLVQIADTFFPALKLPDWSITLVAGLVILGFPIALILAWAYEITPAGIRSETAAAASVPQVKTGEKLNYIILGFVLVAVALLLVDRFALDGFSPRSV